MKIYSKRGDSGATDLFLGQRVSKDNPYVEALGNIDELNSVIGQSVSSISSIDQDLVLLLTSVQADLFVIGSIISCGTEYSPSRIPSLGSDATSNLESSIDLYNAQLPELKNFVLPGGSSQASFLHNARAVARRAERSISTLWFPSDSAYLILPYLNRLSDLLFTLALWINMKLSIPETKWEPYVVKEKSEESL